MQDLALEPHPAHEDTTFCNLSPTSPAPVDVVQPAVQHQGRLTVTFYTVQMLSTVGIAATCNGATRTKHAFPNDATIKVIALTQSLESCAAKDTLNSLNNSSLAATACWCKIVDCRYGDCPRAVQGLFSWAPCGAVQLHCTACTPCEYVHVDQTARRQGTELARKLCGQPGKCTATCPCQGTNCALACRQVLKIDVRMDNAVVTHALCTILCVCNMH